MVNQPLIRCAGDATEGDGVLVFDEYLKILPGLQMHLLPHRTGQDDLAFFRENGSHCGKILRASYGFAKPYFAVVPLISHKAPPALHFAPVRSNHKIPLTTKSHG